MWAQSTFWKPVGAIAFVARVSVIAVTRATGCRPYRFAIYRAFSERPYGFYKNRLQKNKLGINCKEYVVGIYNMAYETSLNGH